MKPKVNPVLKNLFRKLFKEFVKAFKCLTLWRVPKEFTSKVYFKKSKKMRKKLNIAKMGVKRIANYKAQWEHQITEVLSRVLSSHHT